MPLALHFSMCLSTDPIRLTGGHTQLLSLDQSSVNASTPSVLGQKYFELKRANLVFELSANLSIVNGPKRPLITLNVALSIDQSSVSSSLL